MPPTRSGGNRYALFADPADDTSLIGKTGEAETTQGGNFLGLLAKLFGGSSSGAASTAAGAGAAGGTAAGVGAGAAAGAGAGAAAGGAGTAAAGGLWGIPGLTAGGATKAALGAAASAYSANQQKKAAELAAEGSKVTPWGPTDANLRSLLGGAQGAFDAGRFKFGPEQSLLNAYLGFLSGDIGPQGGGMGLDLGGFRFEDPTGYGPAAFKFMTDLNAGVGIPGATRSNPAALLGVQDPFMAALMGGVGTYLALRPDRTDTYVADPNIVQNLPSPNLQMPNYSYDITPLLWSK